MVISSQNNIQKYRTKGHEQVSCAVLGSGEIKGWFIYQFLGLASHDCSSYKISANSLCSFFESEKFCVKRPFKTTLKIELCEWDFMRNKTNNLVKFLAISFHQELENLPGLHIKPTWSQDNLVLFDYSFTPKQACSYSISRT